MLLNTAYSCVTPSQNKEKWFFYTNCIIRWLLYSFEDRKEKCVSFCDFNIGHRLNTEFLITRESERHWDSNTDKR